MKSYQAACTVATLFVVCVVVVAVVVIVAAVVVVAAVVGTAATSVCYCCCSDVKRADCSNRWACQLYGNNLLFLQQQQQH